MKTTILIVGAGPYGVSLAYELWRKNIDFVIVGEPFDSWLSHTLTDTAIRSDHHASEIFSKNKKFNLSTFIEKNFPANAGEIKKSRLPNSLFRAYLRDVLNKIPFPIYKKQLISLEKDENGFVGRMEDGVKIDAKKVVLATGIGVHKQLPESLRSLDTKRIHHSWDVREYEAVKGKKVMVIGAGQSAAECVQHIQKHNNVTWALRKTPVFYSEPINLPKPIFKLLLQVSPAFYFMPLPMKRAFGRKFVETTITPDMEEVFRSQDTKVILGLDADTMRLEVRGDRLYSPIINQMFDHIVCATGFQLNLLHLTFISDSLLERIQDADGPLTVDFNFETKVEGLYIIGGMVEPVYGPAQRFLMGMRHSTLRLGKVLTHG